MNIVGYDHEFNRLKSMILNNNLPHAMLFTGTEGIGKRQIATELSRIILCHKNGEENCDCPSCKAFYEQTHPDFHLLVPTVKGKASPLIRIDDIGELLKSLSLMPVLSNSRVALIDDADFMNDAAANRLLKTLEEPTGDVKFFLIASKRSKILPTILSRTMPVAFPALDEEIIINLLKARGSEEETAREAARLSFGSMKKAVDLIENDGLKIIDECLNFLSNELTYKIIFKMSESMGKEEKSHTEEFLSALLLILRDIMLYHEGANLSEKYSENLINKYDKMQVFKLLALTQEYEKRISANINLRLFIEGYLLKFKQITGGI